LGDQVLYESLMGASMDFVIRFRSRIVVTDAQGDTFAAAALVPGNGRAKKYSDLRVTDDKTSVPAIVCVRGKKMKHAWCLATSRDDLGASEIVVLYGRRFTKENVRDATDPRFGLGLSSTRVGRTDRRDRLLLLGALTQVLLTLLGVASEETGLDRTLKANTAKHRTMSLFNQGWLWYQAIPRMHEERLHVLMKAFGRIVCQHAVSREVFGVI
jgi:hypothetical protein